MTVVIVSPVVTVVTVVTVATVVTVVTVVIVVTEVTEVTNKILSHFYFIPPPPQNCDNLNCDNPKLKF